MQQNLIFDSYYTSDMKPPKDKLEPFVNDREAAAKKFGVCERTICRWMQHYGILIRKNNMGCNKLDLAKAREIRREHSEGVCMNELAEKYGVTFSTISRVVHKINYKEPVKETAEVHVVYNPK